MPKKPLPPKFKFDIKKILMDMCCKPVWSFPFVVFLVLWIGSDTESWKVNLYFGFACLIAIQLTYDS